MSIIYALVGTIRALRHSNSNNQIVIGDFNSFRVFLDTLYYRTKAPALHFSVCARDVINCIPDCVEKLIIFTIAILLWVAQVSHNSERGIFEYWGQQRLMLRNNFFQHTDLYSTEVTWYIQYSWSWEVCILQAQTKTAEASYTAANEYIYLLTTTWLPAKNTSLGKIWIIEWLHQLLAKGFCANSGITRIIRCT
jgi:hypothetical protein